jgi:hypothetical protein
MKHSILVATPSWGDVYIAFRSDTTVLELFWNGNRVLSANQRKSRVGMAECRRLVRIRNGVIADADQEILKLIAEA